MLTGREKPAMALLALFNQFDPFCLPFPPPKSMSQFCCLSTGPLDFQVITFASSIFVDTQRISFWEKSTNLCHCKMEFLKTNRFMYAEFKVLSKSGKDSIKL